MDQDPTKKTGHGRSKESSDEGEGAEMRIKINERRRAHAVSDDADTAGLLPPDEAEDARDAIESSEPSQPSQPFQMDDLRAKLTEAEAKQRDAERQISDLADRFRKAQAQLRTEADDIRSRLQRNFDQKVETARGDIVAGLLESLDNLKRAIAAAEASDRQPVDFNTLLEGVRSTASMFESRMKALGLKEVASSGEEFNPEIHEAVEIVEASPENDNRVVSELQPGYRFGDRLIRPARVRVGRALRRSGESE